MSGYYDLSKSTEESTDQGTEESIMSKSYDDPAERAAFTALVAAGFVIIVLTAIAFWLSYTHLADVAREHGLEESPARSWAWPATLDLFIIAGELLTFVSGLRGQSNKWGIGLTIVGSAGSIGLNVAGVGEKAPVLDYIVAAVPPSAALIAFGALMHQVLISVRKRQAAMSPATVGLSRDNGPAVDVPAPVVPAPVVPALVVPAVDVPQPVVPAVDVPQPVVPAPVVPAAETKRPARDKAVVPADVPKRSTVNVSLKKPPTPAPSASGAGTTPDVPADVLEKKLPDVVRWLRDMQHTKDEIKAIVPTLPGYEAVNTDTLRKTVNRAFS
jgi:hypothetical protein